MIEDLWYKNTVIYSLDLETFMDANGDGIGDFEGLMRRLDYLQFLGIETIWLAPFQPTPNRDNGYDTADYYGVDPRHGSGGDFVEFMHQARKRGMKVIIDLVVNHTSDEHPWFQESRSSTDSPKRDWYVWSKKRPKDWDKGMVFPGEQEATWTLDKQSGEYYFHRFFKFQPDLNITNPEVRTEIRRIMGFWLELGVSGFRVDAVPFIIDGTTPDKKPKKHFEFLSEFRKFQQWRSGDAVLLGEANVLPPENRKYFGEDGEGIHMMFNFFVNQHLFYSLASRDARPLIKALEATRELPHTSQWANFLRNHDELDLGRLSEAQRQKVFARFGPDPSMQLFDRGIRRRLAPMLGSQAEEEFAYSVMFSLPGTPVIRYGDEIGMGDDLSLEGRAAVRTPMHWGNEPQAGFSLAKKTVHPVIDDGPYSYEHVNVESQRRDRNSMLNSTARLIRLRKECPEIGWGSWEILPVKAPSVLAIRYDWRGNSLLVVHNFDSKPHQVDIKPGVDGGDVLINLMEEDQSKAGAKGVHQISLNGHAARWYRVGGTNYALSRTKS